MYESTPDSWLLQPASPDHAYGIRDEGEEGQLLRLCQK